MKQKKKQKKGKEKQTNIQTKNKHTKAKAVAGEGLMECYRQNLLRQTQIYHICLFLC